jgi:hypothetical protein
LFYQSKQLLTRLHVARLTSCSSATGFTGLFKNQLLKKIGGAAYFPKSQRLNKTLGLQDKLKLKVM